MKGVVLDTITAAVEQIRGESWETILNRYGDPVKWLTLRLARHYTGMTLAELGAAAGGMDYAALGVALKRLDRKLIKSQSLRKIEAQAAKMLDVKT